MALEPSLMHLPDPVLRHARPCASLSRLTAYARKFHAGPGWHYYTGTVAASLAAQRAFDVYRGEKMSHTLVTLMRATPGKPWLRIEGFVTPDELVDDYRNLLASP